MQRSPPRTRTRPALGARPHVSGALRASAVALVLSLFAASSAAPSLLRSACLSAPFIGAARAEGRVKPDRGAGPAARERDKAAARERDKAAARAERLGLGTLKAAAKLLQGRVEPAWQAAAGPDRWPGALRLPVAEGHVSRGFGSGKAAYHQAVDIAGPLGTPVRSAASGIVAYADGGIPSYGKLAILIHPGGFITTYAHNQKLLVVAGQRVRRAQVIAELGNTGRSMGPHLHTELLWNGMNCDPAPLFRPLAAFKDGRPLADRARLWKDPHKKPKSLRCAPRKHHPDYARTGSGGDDDD